MTSHIAFPVIGPDGFSSVGVYAPHDTDAQRVARGLIADLVRQIHLLHVANIDDRDLAVLIPGDGLPGRVLRELDGGQVYGRRIHVVHGIAGPMLAFPLTVRSLPE